MFARRLLIVLALVLLGAAAAGPIGPVRSAHAQSEQAAEEPFSVTLARWQSQLDQIEAYLAPSNEHDPERTTELRERAAAIRNQALEARSQAQEQIQTLERLLAALGDPPEGDASAEPANVTRTRREYRDDLAVQRSRASLSELAATRADSLDQRLAQLQRQSTVQTLTTRGPVPLFPATVATALPQFLEVGRQTVGIALDWYAQRGPEQRTTGSFLRLALVLTAASAAGALFGRILLRRFGRDADNDSPAYARRFVAAIAEGVGRGLLPASVFIILLALVAGGLTPFDGELSRLVGVLSVVVAIYFLALAMTQAVFAPDLPGWRLIAVAPENARLIGRRIMALATIFAVDMFLTALGSGLQVGEAALSIFHFVFGTLQGIVILSLVRPSLWRTVEGAIPDDPAHEEAQALATRHESDDRSEDGDGGSPSLAARLDPWQWGRLAILLVVVAGIAALTLGYFNLGSYLITSLQVSFLIVGFLVLLRGLLRESVGVLIGSELVRARLGVAWTARRRIKFWLRAALDPLLVVLAAVFVAPVWGVPVSDLAHWLGEVLSGITIGNVTLSIADFALGIAVFVFAVIAVRLFQRALSDHILPETNWDQGVQHSLSAGFGYAGLVAATGLGIAVLGIDLSSLAIIAGALSVGIGFGLRDVVNNFVCGFIMLIERPLKVGDWVVVGENEGFVKRINLRATEIETWQKAAVFVPNAAIIGEPLKNWTHKDRIGRVDIPITVAFGTDSDLMERIMLQAAAHHPRILIRPEPFVLLEAFSESGLFFELRCYTSDVVWYMVVASELRRDIDRRLCEAGIVIPYPQRTLHVGLRGEGANASPPVDAEGRPLTPDNPPRPQNMHPPSPLRAAPGGESPDGAP
ncbi:MAG: mechanosensitive ion channel [Azospirillaceae bacterium]